MDFSSVNWLAVVACVIVSFAVGFFYFSPKVFFDTWWKALGKTGQPDMGSVLVQYDGPRIDRMALLRYIVSFRRHRAFHEACVERMFIDVLRRCRPERLTVYARYLRRGGIDINPFRSNFETDAPNLRLARQ